MKPIRLDPDDKQLQQTALGLLAAGDWGGLTALARALPPQSAYAMLQLLAEAAPLTADVSHLIASKDAMDLTVAGALLHGRAVRHRGVGMAEDVTEDQWELYIPTLAHAQELLAEANRRAPELGLAAAWRVSAFIDATEEQKDEAEIALRRATGIPVSGLSRLITMRSEKWGGSHDEMWRVVADYAEAALPGSLALIAKAHFEQWLWYSAFDEGPDAAATAEAYLHRKDVREDLIEASKRVLAAREPSDPRAILLADNAFAATFWTSESAKDARPHLQRMGRNIDRTVWLFENPRLALNVARARAWLLPV
ncbi:MAG TPA: hypothetical protein VGB65_01935 [Allosphingosinicella sp.]